MDLADNDPFVMAFKIFVNCIPVHSYIINVLDNIITYYCGNNNSFIIQYNYVESIIDKCR
jgi:hypothetical protein